MAKNTSITLGLRLLEENDMKLKVLRKALQEGEASERVACSLDQLLTELNAEEA